MGASPTRQPLQPAAGILVFCADYRCSHCIRLMADRWPDDARLSDIEPRFVCTACGKRGADVRPDFKWSVTRAIGGMRLPLIPLEEPTKTGQTVIRPVLSPPARTAPFFHWIVGNGGTGPCFAPILAACP